MYLTIIIVATIIISVLNILFNSMVAGFSPLWTICAVVLGVILEVVIDGILAFVIHSMPEKWFDKNKKIFDVSRKERKFYEKLKIKNWKDKVAELGALGGFRKNKVADPNDPKYLQLFIVENNKGITLHIAGIIFGFLILLFPMPKYALYIGLPIAFVNLYLNLLSVMVLRYNIPKLKIAMERALKKQQFLTKQNEEEKLSKEYKEIKN